MRRNVSPTAVDDPHDPAESSVRVAVVELFAARVAGASPRELAQRFAENVDLGVDGGTCAAPWTSRRTGRAGIGEHLARLGETVHVEHVDLDTIRAEGNQAVVMGTFQARFRATGLPVGGEFAVDIAVGDDGLITRYHVLEDCWSAPERPRSDHWALGLPCLRQAP